jgi:wyosine [tRNA(Phe)-imidazoG37] synthetase (radical SAM superfamily)
VAVLELQKGIIYGPINSRRLGKSLGINLLPVSYKTCPYNCIYCHYGWTDRYWRTDFSQDLPQIVEVEEALTEAIANSSEKNPAFAYITFSGNGEPTTHPQFAEIVAMVRNLRDSHCPNVKIALLSNSALVDRPEVRQAISGVDLPIMKMDAGNEELWRKINQPAPGVDFGGIVEGLSQMKGMVIQTLFLTGEEDNSTREAVGEWRGMLKKVGPREVQIYTTDRPTAERGIVKVPRRWLEKIAAETGSELGIPVNVY